jgi:membrane-associated phospholipid phosphatase
MKKLIKHYYSSLTPTDILIGTHCLVMIFLIALRGSRAPETAILYSVKYFIILLAAVIAGPALDRVKHPLVQNQVIQSLRHLYPVFLLAPFYQWSLPISYLYFSTPFDDILLRADMALFRFNIARDLVYLWGNHYWLTEWMNFSYLSYYWVTLYLPFYLFFKKLYREFFYVVFITLMIVFSCFIFHAVFPAQGPVHFDPDKSGYLVAGPVSEFARQFLIRADIPGGAMPSSHIAGTVAVCLFAWRYLRKAFWITLPVVVSLCVSTVYCRYHYVVDGIVGLAVAFVGVYLVGPWLYSRLFPHLPQETREGYDELTVPA